MAQARIRGHLPHLRDGLLRLSWRTDPAGILIGYRVASWYSVGGWHVIDDEGYGSTGIVRDETMNMQFLQNWMVIPV